MKTKVSFVVTVYNKKMYLERTLEALKNQTGDFEREYIFVDDCSTDNSVDVIKGLTFGWKDDIILHRMDKNSGVCPATKKGIKLATGDYIKFVDADDVLFPDTTLKLLEAIEKYGIECATCRHGKLLKDEVVDRFYPDTKILGDTQVYRTPIKQVLDGSCLFLGNSMMLVKASIAKEASKLLDTADRRQQDYRLSLYIANKCDIAFCNFIGLYEWGEDDFKLSDYKQDVCFYYNSSSIIDFIKNSEINEYDLGLAYSGCCRIMKLGMKKHYKFRRLYQLMKMINPKIKFNNKNMTIEKLECYLKEYKRIVFKGKK